MTCSLHFSFHFQMQSSLERITIGGSMRGSTILDVAKGGCTCKIVEFLRECFEYRVLKA